MSVCQVSGVRCQVSDNIEVGSRVKYRLAKNYRPCYEKTISIKKYAPHKIIKPPAHGSNKFF